MIEMIIRVVCVSIIFPVLAGIVMYLFEETYSRFMDSKKGGRK